MVYYKDAKIKIRDITDEDIDYLFICRLDKETNKYDSIPIPKNSKELISECSEYCRIFETEIINENIDDRKYRYFMVTDTNDLPIGFVNFFSINGFKKQGEMGVVIEDKRYWNKGIGTKAVSTAVNYIFSNMDIKRIYIQTNENNVQAIGLFNKLGFKKCGEFVEDDNFKCIVMEIKKSL